MANAPIMPDRNLALELVRVTESAAMAAPAGWVGVTRKGPTAAVDAMRHMLRSVSMDGVVVIGEGEKDEAPMLYNGERIGDGTDAETDIAVDPIDGTTLTALGRGNALAVIAVSPRGTMYDPGPCMYMEKMRSAPKRRGQSASTRRSPRTSTMWPRRRVRKCRISPSSSSTVTDTPTTYARYERPAPDPSHPRR